MQHNTNRNICRTWPMMDPNLNFYTHINTLKSKAKQILEMLKKPLEYNTVIWSLHIEKNRKDTASSSQMSNEYKKLSIQRLIKHLKLQTLSYRRLRKDLIEVIKSIKKHKQNKQHTLFYGLDKHMFQTFTRYSCKRSQQDSRSHTFNDHTHK